ncbi:kinesin-like protein [Elasticomyces elasticus]|uniref:Kinesin-like protein n=1 Tax=Elasticomyces elasticus TaxID=574655 RepID=A0AAN7W9X3_9PEZI|nr:kinesin-like protein [Elasticomyces elasticus]
MAPSTFASAAAGSNPSTPLARDGGSEWGRRTNGATQTFRRASGATMASQNTQPDPTQPPPRYVPPHRNGTLGDLRYSKDQLVDFFKTQQGADGGLKEGLNGLYVGGWQPDMANGNSSAGWGRADHSRDAQPGPDICWDRDGSIEPLALSDMDDDEKELFSNSVNSIITRQPANKDGQQPNGRRISISNNAGTPGGYGLPSPSATRGFGRRRETSESYPFPGNALASPTVGRDDQRAPSPPPSLQRRRTDFRDDQDGEDKSATTPFGTLRRHQTGPLSAGLTGPSSPWSAAPQSAGMSPMGSFGNFGLGGQQGSGDKRPGLGSGRLESRFKNVLEKNSNEEIGSPTVQRKGSMSSLARVNENESWRPQDDVTAALAEAEEEMHSGSAALGAGTDLSPAPQPRQGLRGFGTPSRSNTLDEGGFGAFGMTADNAHGFGRDAYQQTPVTQRANQHLGGNDPMSPSDTNPYRSPDQYGIDRLTEDTDGLDMHNAPLPGLGGFGQDQGQAMGGFQGLGSLGRAPGMQGPASERSQTSSSAGGRAFPGLGGLGQLGGVSGSAAWPVTQPGFGTPSRQTAGLSTAFGGGIFSSSTAELQSPSLAGLGGPNLLGSQGGAGFGGSRMASMFPPAMQDQMRQGDFRGDERDGSNERSVNQPFAGLGSGLGDMQSPFAGQAQSAQPGENMQSQFGLPGQMQQTNDHASFPSGDQAGQPPGSSASNQPPAPQQKTMVMPDRMRWIYRDPQGQTQGPWTGLEMHDWYKAGFFSPELLVKKYEDTDYEPLAQLIRRIGNSREPFLVPQIGIPHGAVSNNGPTAWAGTAAGPGPSVGAGAGPATIPNTTNPASAGGVQPPFASSFPSFGTTLTADQQNALERRKQEEQYLMARQKEHLAQAQMAQRMQPPSSQHGLAPSQLNHHSSVQSLHSQPSFGSISSPNAFQPSPTQAPAGGNVAGFFDNSFRSPQSGGLGAVGAGVDSLGHIREEEIPGIMDRLSMNERSAPGQFGAPGQPFSQQQQQQAQQPQHHQQVQQMYEDRARLQQEQAQHDAAQQHVPNEQAGPNERLQQFQQLQGQGLDARFQPAVGKSEQKQAPATQNNGAPPSTYGQQEPLSLTEQVEAAVSAQQSPAPQQGGLPQPFPPAPSQSPLPAPAAQRTGRQSVADQLQTESRDMSQTPSVDTPSAAVAPWAKEPAEGPKGPSLREIQEIEAKKAAEVEALASAARRAAAEKEMEALAQVQAPQPGLPSSSSWGATASPATPVNGTSAAWTKAAQKTTGPSTKSMAQIQKEEEARKKRQVAAALAAQASVTGAVAAPTGGKSYANLASKVTLPPAGPGPAWTTVGAGGKSKTPAPATPAVPRTVSSGIVPGLQPVAPRKVPSRTTTSSNASTVNAQEEFRKWAVGELRPDLNKSISRKSRTSLPYVPVTDKLAAEDFVATLCELGNDRDMITEAVHGVTNKVDSRHFSEEFLRRKKMADKGLIDTSAPMKSTASPHHASNGQSGGGWSEVAKKGPQVAKEAAAAKEEGNGSFRMVPAKKKGSKR